MLHLSREEEEVASFLETTTIMEEDCLEGIMEAVEVSLAETNLN